ncbi:hypothetical protein ACHAPF_002051 [Botrytis cinerea]
MSPSSVKVARGRRPESNRKPEKTGRSRSRSSNPDSGKPPSNNQVAESRERGNKKSSSSETDGSTKDDRVKVLEDEEKGCNGYIKSSGTLSKTEIRENVVFESKASFYRRHKLRTQKKLLELLKDLKEPTDELEMAIRTHQNQYGDEE